MHTPIAWAQSCGVVSPRLALVPVQTPVARRHANAFFGGMIETIQMIQAINRDASVSDWLADALAVATTLLVMASMRRLIGPAQSGATIK